MEEALCNAVYHRGYDNNSTIEVRIYPSRIDIISYPGTLPPLDKEKLKNLQFDVRKYRNRRIGEFLKELHLTEGRATGIPCILKSLEKNGSPKPVFETDDERSYFKTTFRIHPEFLITDKGSMQVSIQVREQANFFIIKNLDEIYTAYTSLGEQVREQVKDQLKATVTLEKIKKLVNTLILCRNPQNRKIILENFGLSNIFKNYKSHISVLVENELLERTIPDKPTSPNQKYRTTEKGIKLLSLLK